MPHPQHCHTNRHTVIPRTLLDPPASCITCSLYLYCSTLSPIPFFFFWISTIQFNTIALLQLFSFLVKFRNPSDMESWPSIWFLIRSWLTPAVLFLLLNLVIGTIAITSKTLLSHIHHPHAGEAENHGIARTAIHRLRSLSLMRLRSGDLFFDSSISAAVGQQKSDEISEVELDKKRVLEPEGEEKRLLEPEGEEKRVLEKEGEEKRLLEKEGEGVMVEEVVEDGVDARADDFINRFRQQLHLQRLDSLLKYKDMLSGGGR